MIFAHLTCASYAIFHRLQPLCVWLVLGIPQSRCTSVYLRITELHTRESLSYSC
ncbi:hypothetical protein WH47_10071 [Habropoda laboriosa]|uniref:Uncharacterized protein n=1 Tax=Habropoda laboriosa TaxID=597456 RepID=A0A0L7R414_9HYME|nr:hypothetical protein WH47_10071 [Habropoda laboriosa]